MKKGINYVMYILIILVIVVGVYFFFGGSTTSGGNEETPKEELVIKKNVIDLKVGEEGKVEASVTNNSNATIKYVSTNPSIATVDENGNLKGISNGTTYIIVNYVSSNNDTYNKQCVVNVSGGIEITSISLPNGELLMKPNDTFKLDVTTEPADVDKSKLSYIVNNSNIITVSEDGTVTAVGEGIAALRVSAKENINADIRVRVVNNPEVVSGIYIMPDKITSVRSMTLKVGEERKIDYTVEPADAYMQNAVWESKSPNVATVTDGVVTAVSEGDATITMKTINGITLTIYVTVKPSTVEVESIKLTSESALELKVGDSSQISYEVLPSEATDKSVTFQSNNTAVANVDSKGLITAVGEGSAVVRITSSSGAKTADIMVNVKKKSSSGGDGGGSSCSGTTHVGNVNSSLLGSPTDEGFDKCKRVSQNLVPFIGGTNYGQDGYYVMHVGETLTVNVKLPTICGRIDRLTRTNHDGQSGWSNYVSQTSSPKVNRNDSSTYVSGVDGYTWKITANKKGCVIVSQTAQFDVTSPSGRTGNMKSMIRLHIKIED